MKIIYQPGKFTHAQSGRSVAHTAWSKNCTGSLFIIRIRHSNSGYAQMESYLKAISPWVPTCSNAHSWQLYSPGKWGRRHHDLISPQSHYHDPELTSPCRAVQLMTITRLGNNMYKLFCHELDLTRKWTASLPLSRPQLYWLGHRTWYAYTYYSHNYVLKDMCICAV